MDEVALPRGRHDRAQRTEALLGAATIAFAEHGYVAATTLAIATRAGCAEGLIHRYYGGKRGLLNAVLCTPPPPFAPCLSADNVRLDEVLAASLGVLWQHRLVLRVIVAQALYDPLAAKALTRWRQALTDALGVALEQAGATADAAASTGVAAGALWFGLAVSQIVAPTAEATIPAAVAELAEAAATLLTRGVGARACAAGV